MAYNRELAERIEALLAGTPGWVGKKMFGGVGYLVNGNMLCGVLDDGLILRLSDEDYQAARSRSVTRAFGVRGKRPMTGWLVVDPPGWLAEEDLRVWLGKAQAFNRQLPPKA